MSATRERVHVAADIHPAVCDKAALKTVAITKGDDNEGQYGSALNISFVRNATVRMPTLFAHLVVADAYLVRVLERHNVAVGTA